VCQNFRNRHFSILSRLVLFARQRVRGVSGATHEKGTTPGTALTQRPARSEGIYVLGRERLLQLCVLGLGLLQDGDVGVGVFPARLDYCGSPILYSRSAKRRSERRSWNLGSVFIEVIQ